MNKTWSYVFLVVVMIITLHHSLKLKWTYSSLKQNWHIKRPNLFCTIQLYLLRYRRCDPQICCLSVYYKWASTLNYSSLLDFQPQRQMYAQMSGFGNRTLSSDVLCRFHTERYLSDSIWVWQNTQISYRMWRYWHYLYKTEKQLIL